MERCEEMRSLRSGMAFLRGRANSEAFIPTQKIREVGDEELKRTLIIVVSYRKKVFVLRGT